MRRTIKKNKAMKNSHDLRNACDNTTAAIVVLYLSLWPWSCLKAHGAMPIHVVYSAITQKCLANVKYTLDGMGRHWQWQCAGTGTERLGERDRERERIVK